MDDSQLKYYFPPDLSKPNNLSVNYDKYISRDLTVDEHIDALLEALICIRDREEQHASCKSTSSISPKDAEGDCKDDNGLTSQPSASPSSALTAKTQPKQRQQQQQSSTTKADFVCYRGILTKIMCTPYARNEPWQLRATLFKGTIYIEEHVSPEKRKDAGGSNERHKLMSYWGYRFETICNISKPVSELRTIKVKKRRRRQDLQADEAHRGNGEGNATRSGGDTLAGAVDTERREKRPRTDLADEAVSGKGDCKHGDSDHGNGGGEDKEGHKDKDDDHGNDDDDYEVIEEVDLNDPELTGRLDGIVDTNLQYCTVARTKLGRNSIIMGAEVDCISEPKRPPPHNPLTNYIELKTSRVISNPRERNSFERHKLLKFWAQSFLPGIPTIIVGFRDDDGNVVTVETFKTMEIPRLVRGKEGAWDTTICINFLDGVFNFLRKIIVVDDPETTYTIRWDAPFKAIEVEFDGKRNKFLTEQFLSRWNRDDPEIKD
ncbi:hypothetical protein BGX34_004463 [Mortierella sp. NVP85]|nr:hypothetical protein BGX34_004463 [Mortierella sp. NVP85]